VVCGGRAKGSRTRISLLSCVCSERVELLTETMLVGKEVGVG